MKIKASKLVAVILAVVLVFGAVAVAASAANSNPYVKVSSVVNAVVGATDQEITVSLSPDTELKNAKLVLTGDATKIDQVNAVANSAVTGIAVSQTNGTITIDVTSAVNNTTSDLALATISFDFEDSAKGAIALTATASAIDDTQPATIADKDWGVSVVKGEEGEVYTNMVGLGLDKFIKSAGKTAPLVDAEAQIKLVALDGTEFDVEIPVSTAFHGTNVMSEEEFAKFVETNKAAVTKKVQEVLNNKEVTYDDFDLDTDSILLNGAEIKVTDRYDEKAGEYVYTATMKQCEPTKAIIKVVFRAAFENKDLYHSSNISDYNIEMTVHEGKTIASQATIITYMKQHIDLYNQTKGDLDTNDDGTDDITVDGVKLNQHIKDCSAGQYDLGDFVLDESVVAFNNAKITGSEKYSANADENVFTVYFDQINVPKTVLDAAADAFGKINYSQFARAHVVAINEAIGAFQAFADSLVNAEWPSAEDVEEDEDKDDSDSPSTGSVIGLGSALAVVAALSATAVAIVRKKED